MSKEGIYGNCKYCGQAILLEVEETNISEEEKNRLASEKCTCSSASYNRTINISIERARQASDKFFKEKYPETNELLKKAIEYVKKDKIKQIVIDNGDGTKGKVKMNSKGAIVVELSISRKTSQELQ